MDIVAVIPARYESSHFSGKPLANLFEKPLLWWAYQNCKSVSAFQEVVVATDDNRIFQSCEELGINVLMTSELQPTETDLICEVAKSIKADLFVNMPVSKPLLDTNTIIRVTEPFRVDNGLQVCGLMTKINNPPDLMNVFIPKVVTKKDNTAFYLTRSAAPFFEGTMDATYFKDVGVYAFTPKALDFFSEYGKAHGKAKIESIENIDILRFIEDSIPVHYIEAMTDSDAINTPKDIEKLEAMIRKSSVLVIRTLHLRAQDE